MTKENEDKILGIKKTEIRKAFFSQNLKSILNKVQALEPMTEEKLKELETYLSELKEEENKFAKDIMEVFGSEFVEDKDLPSIDEMQGDTKELSEEWKEKERKSEEWLNANYQKIKDIQEKNNASKDFWLNLSTNLIVLQSTLDKIRVFNDQLYRAKLISIKEKYGISRAEAEEYAKLGNEYRDYKNSLLQRDRIEQLIINCRRHEERTNYK